MVRTAKRKSNESYGKTPPETMREAVRLVLAGKGLRGTAAQFCISKSTLQRYVGKARTFGINTRMEPGWDNRRIFSDVQELEIENYLVTASKLHHGLSTVGTKALAYEYAIKNKIPIPEQWRKNKAAGFDWLYGFMKRHTNLTIRKPEPTSLSRATSFNKKNVTEFFDNFETVLNRHHFREESIYNADETALTTVHRPPNVIAEKGCKQVGQITSAERGALVTMNGAVNALGNSIPPFLIFPRVNYKAFMIRGAPAGTKGVASKTGWMTKKLYVEWLNHFIKYSHASKENPVLLITDNHESHISIEAIDTARDSGVTILTLPPHTSHKMQPLDRTVYGPLKSFYNAACDSWQLSHPGQPMSIYDVAENLGKAYPRAFTPENITSGFRVTGLHPLDRNVFKDDEYLASFVTDRPCPAEAARNLSSSQTNGCSNDVAIAVPSTSNFDTDIMIATPLDSHNELDTPVNQHFGTPGSSDQPEGTVLGISDPVNTMKTPVKNLDAVSLPATSAAVDNDHFTPEQVRPYPKAGARKTKLIRRKKKSVILTDTPVRKQICADLLNKSVKKCSKPKLTASKKSVKTSVLLKKNDQSDTDSSVNMNETDDSDIDFVEEFSDDESNQEYLSFNVQDIKVGDFLLVKYDSKTAVRHFVGKVCKLVDDLFEVIFLTRQPTRTKLPLFTFPDKEDKDLMELDDIIIKLPQPSPIGGTARASKQLKFDIDLSSYF